MLQIRSMKTFLSLPFNLNGTAINGKNEYEANVLQNYGIAVRVVCNGVIDAQPSIPNTWTHRKFKFMLSIVWTLYNILRVLGTNISDVLSKHSTLTYAGSCLCVRLSGCTLKCKKIFGENEYRHQKCGWFFIRLDAHSIVYRSLWTYRFNEHRQSSDKFWSISWNRSSIHFDTKQ